MLRESSQVLLEECRCMMGTGVLRPPPAMSIWPGSPCLVEGKSEHSESLLWPTDVCLRLSGDAGNCRRLPESEFERRESQLLRPRDSRRWLSGDAGNCSRCLDEGESVECRESLLRTRDACLSLSGDDGSCMIGTGAV